MGSIVGSKASIRMATALKLASFRPATQTARDQPPVWPDRIGAGGGGGDLQALAASAQKSSAQRRGRGFSIIGSCDFASGFGHHNRRTKTPRFSNRSRCFV